MKANVQMNLLHKQVIKRYHTLAALCGLTEEEKKAIVSSYDAQSSADMQTHDLIDVCAALQKQLDERSSAGQKSEMMNKLRKHCLKCLCAYIDIKRLAINNKIVYAKQIACQATRRDNFNRLTAAELRGVIGYFNREREAYERSAVAVRDFQLIKNNSFQYN